MGASLCSFRRPRPRPESPRKMVGSCDQDFGTSSPSVIGFFKPAYLRNERQLSQSESRITMLESLTLQECLLASPSLDPKCITAGELHVFRQLPKRDCSASPKMHTNFFTPRNSFSADRLSKIDEGDKDELSSVSSMSRSQSEKLKKKVSFRLPDEADIIIFCSPKETLEE